MVSYLTLIPFFGFQHRQRPIPNETGHLYYCAYNDRTWSAPKSHRSQLKVQLEEVSDPTSQSGLQNEHRKQSSIRRPKFFRSSSRQKQELSQKSGELVSPDDSPDRRDSAGSDILPIGNENVPPTGPTDVVAATHKSIRLSYMFCKLDSDATLYVYSAHKDKRSRFCLPLVGMRILYLGPKKMSVVAKKQLESCDSAPVYNESSNNINIPAPLCPPPVKPMTPDNGDNNHQYHQTHNPMYRLKKPPKTAGAFDVDNPTNAFDRRNSDPFSPSSLSSASQSTSSPLASPTATTPAFGRRITVDAPMRHPEQSVQMNELELQRQIEQISPRVMLMLRNELGFIILPNNTDELAHYFEAQTKEARQQ